MSPPAARTDREASLLVELDGQRFHGGFTGFDAPLDIAAPDGRVLRLAPWTYPEHIAALRAAVQPGQRGLGLDPDRFAGRVLEASGLGAERWLAPLALWWAAGGEASPPELQGGRAGLGGGRQVQLRAWSEGERLAALGAALLLEAGEPRWLDAVGYLDAMVRASVVAFEAPAETLSLETLDSGATARLLDAVVALNLHQPGTDPLLSGALPAAAQRRTLELCRALGWTPAQVLAAPAPEVQRLLALLRAEEAAPVVPAGLGHRPGAVLIQFADDEP